MTDVNYLAIIASAVASMVVGSIWFGPLFGQKYMTEIGIDKWSPEKQAEIKKSMTITYVWQFAASLLGFYILAMFIALIGKTDVMGALQVAFWAWLGFIIPQKLGDSLWGGKMSLFWLGAGNSLITILVGATILGLWR